jgi:polar amino acid transport system substrate-binding protein
MRLLQKLRAVVVGAAVACAVAPVAIGSAEAQTIESIKKGGVLKIGSQVAQVPWGFTDSSGKLTGFDIELGEMLAKDLGVKADVSPVTSSNRVAALLTGQVDVLAAVMGIFPDRQKVVLFSRPYTTNDTVYIGKASANIKGWNDLKGVRVGVPRGTPQDIAITKAAPAGAVIQRFDDDASTVQALIAGQVDMIGGAATQVPNIAQVAGPGKFEEKFVVARAYNAFAVRPDAREWANYLSDFVARKLASGELPALYKKWIGGQLAQMPDTGEGEAALPVSMVQ